MRAPLLNLHALATLSVLLSATACESVLPDPSLELYTDTLGAPIGSMRPELLPIYEHGRAAMDLRFDAATGLGPTFNAASCANCHQFPVAGGSAPRYRDFFLVRTQRADGTLIDAGTNGTSPVRNIYSLPYGHEAEPDDVAVFARRNTPAAFGVGLFAFVPDREILSREDPDDRKKDQHNKSQDSEQ